MQSGYMSRPVAVLGLLVELLLVQVPLPLALGLALGIQLHIAIVALPSPILC